ncbi:MAG: hypothetical protein PHH06_01065 [Candidatus Gracilibacteria bacterium]|nr:hypothetical protein [Candidatus Gracilibacteria bacterium]
MGLNYSRDYIILKGTSVQGFFDEGEIINGQLNGDMCVTFSGHELEDLLKMQSKRNNPYPFATIDTVNGIIRVRIEDLLEIPSDYSSTQPFINKSKLN